MQPAENYENRPARLNTSDSLYSPAIVDDRNRFHCGGSLR